MAVRGGKREFRGEKHQECPTVSGSLEVNPMYEDILRAVDNPRFSKFLLIGGMRSGKSRQLMIWMVTACFKPADVLPEHWLRQLRLEGVGAPTILIAREVFKDVKKTLWEDVVWVCKQMRIWPDDGKENGLLKVNKSDYTLTFKESGGQIWFAGASDDSSGMGVSPHFSWLNEISEISEAYYRQVNSRTKLGSFFDCNPKMFANHWARKELLPQEGGNVWVHRSTWKDNKFLPPKVRAEIAGWEPTEENIRKGTADEYWWKVYGLGIFAVMEGQVFPEGRTWDFCNEEDFPDMRTTPSVYCLDFGWSDPMAFCRVAIRGNDLFVDELLYERELLISAPASNPGVDCLDKRLKRLGIPKNAIIAADSASTEQIEMLQASGWTGVTGIKKPSGSIRWGIGLMKGRFIRVTRRSGHWAIEAQEYCWPSGDKVRDPDTVNPRGRAGDHLLDAARYGAMYLLGKDGNVRAGVGGIGRPTLKSVKGVRYDY